MPGAQRHYANGLSKKEYDFTKAKRGPVVTPPPGKTRVTIRLDKDVLDWFHNQVDESGGGNYQKLINDALPHAGAKRWNRQFGG